MLANFNYYLVTSRKTSSTENPLDEGSRNDPQGCRVRGLCPLGSTELDKCVMG